MEKERTPVRIGAVVAERTFAAFRADGTNVFLTVRLGAPFREPSLGDYRCPTQIVGLGDERVVAPWGEDPFVALQYAIDFLGQMLDQLVLREQLEIRNHQGNSERSSWIWKYPPHRAKD